MQDADAYIYLNALGASAFAWEFLRRDSDHRTAYWLIVGNSDAVPETSERVARQWGLRFAVDVDLRADCSRVVWLPHLNPATVIIAPAPDEFIDARPISDLARAFSPTT